jgi:hypothetical protein
LFAEVGDHGVDVGALAAERLQEPEAPFHDRGRPGQAVPGEVGGHDPGMGGPPAVHPLDGATGAVGLQQPGAHARRDPGGVGDAVRVQPTDHRGGHGGTHRPADRGGVLTPLEEHRVAELPVVAAHPEPDGHLDAHAGRVEQRGRGGAGGLGHREGGRHDR